MGKCVAKHFELQTLKAAVLQIQPGRATPYVVAKEKVLLALTKVEAGTWKINA